MSTKLGTLTLDLVAKIGKFVEPMKKAGDTTQRESKRIESSMSSAAKSITALGAVALGGLTVGAVIESADAYTQMAARIRNATESTQEYTVVQDRLFKTANTTFRSLAEAQEVYLSMSGGMKSLGYNTSQTLDMTDSLSFAFTANATRADQAQSAMDALSKSMAKGKVDADAWISIATGADNIIADMAKTTGRTEAEIRQLGATGKISLDELISTLIQTKDANEALANNMENSLADGMQKLSNATRRFFGELNMSTGATGKLASSLGALADNVDKVAIAGGVVASVYVGKLTPAIFASGKSFIFSSVEAVRYQIVLARMSAQAAGTSTALTVMGGAARGALALFGGPLGLAVTVAGVAASYLLMRDSGDKANAMLETQSRYASMAADELNKLEGAQLRAAKSVLSKELGILNNKLKASENQFESIVESVLDSNKTNQEAYRVWAELRGGVIGVDEAYSRLNKANFVTNDQIEQLTNAKKKVDDSKVALQNANTQLDKVKTSGQSAKQGFTDVATGAQDAAGKVVKLNDKLLEFNKSLESRAWDAEFKAAVIAQGKSAQEADLLLETYRKNQAEGVKGITAEQKKLINNIVMQESALSKLTSTEKTRTSELEKQLKIANRLIGISGNSGIGTGAHLDVRYGGSLSGQKVSQDHLSRLNAGGKPLSAYRVSSDYGPRKAPTAGASSFHKGIDYAMPVGTPITTNVAVKDIKTSYDSKGGGYYSTVTFEDGVVLKLLHQSPDMVGKIKGGASSSSSNSSTNTQIDLEKEIATLKSQLDNEAIRRAKEREEKINQATLLGQKNLIPKIQERYDAQDKIAKLQLEAELNSHKWTEEQKLQNTHAINVQRLTAEGKYSDEQKALVKQALDEQLAYELQAYKKVQEQKRIAIYEAFYKPLSEMHAMGMNALAQTSLTPLQLEKWQMQQDQQSGYSQLGDSFNDAINGIDANELMSEEQKAKERLATYQDYLENKAALTELYSKQEQDLQNSQHAASLAGYGAMFGMMGSMLDAYGEKSSASYKAAFALQRAFVLSSALLNAKSAVMSEWGNPAYTSIWQKMAGVAAVVVKNNELMSAIQGVTLTGMAHDGIDAVPKEGTWLLDKGERVVDARTNADLKSYLANGGGSGGEVKIEVYVTESSVTTSGTNTQDQKQLGQMIGNAVRTVIRQEQRQGGLLAK